MKLNCDCLSCGDGFVWTGELSTTAQLLCGKCWGEMTRWYRRLNSKFPYDVTLKPNVIHPDHVHAWLAYDKAIREKQDVR